MLQMQVQHFHQLVVKVVVSTGILTATLAADTPAAGIAVGGAARFLYKG